MNVTAVAADDEPSGNDQVSVFCDLYQGTTVIGLSSVDSDGEAGVGPDGTIAITVAPTFGRRARSISSARAWWDPTTWPRS